MTVASKAPATRRSLGAGRALAADEMLPADSLRAARPSAPRAAPPPPPGLLAPHEQARRRPRGERAPLHSSVWYAWNRNNYFHNPIINLYFLFLRRLRIFYKMYEYIVMYKKHFYGSHHHIVGLDHGYDF